MTRANIMLGPWVNGFYIPLYLIFLITKKCPEKVLVYRTLVSCLLLLGQVACDAATRLACVTLRGDPIFDARTVLPASTLC
jgi:hypothetical protein